MAGCHSPAEKQLVQKATPRAVPRPSMRGANPARMLLLPGAAGRHLKGFAGGGKLLLAGELSLCDRHDGLVYFILCVAKTQGKKKKTEEKNQPASTKRRSDTALPNCPRSEVSLLAGARLPSLLGPRLSSSFAWHMKS